MFDMEAFVLRLGIARAIDARRRETVRTRYEQQMAAREDDAAAAAAAATAVQAYERAEVSEGRQLEMRCNSCRLTAR